jgi:hypothetical protein
MEHGTQIRTVGMVAVAVVALNFLTLLHLVLMAERVVGQRLTIQPTLSLSLAATTTFFGVMRTLLQAEAEVAEVGTIIILTIHMQAVLDTLVVAVAED